MKEKLSRSITLILFANILNFLFNIISNFLLPKFLPMEVYADIKTFTLYLSYAGFLHLGYQDGMYLKYGGMSLLEINPKELEVNMSTHRVFQAIVSVLIVMMGIVLNDVLVVIFGMTILPFNMIMYYRNLYQAIGEFKLYSKLSNVITITLFVLNMVLLFLLKQNNVIGYLCIYILVYGGIWLYMELQNKRSKMFKMRLFFFSIEELIANIKSGIFLMLGTFSSILLTSIDRLCIKISMNDIAFAEYSFAVSMESFLNVATSPLSTTLYNYFCKVTDAEEINTLKRYLIVFVAVLVASAYPLKYIVQNWIFEYRNSMSVLFLLFAAQLYFVVIKSVYVNLYKAQKKQNVYFAKLVGVICFGVVLNIILFVFMRCMEAFALGTLLSGLFWMLLCQFDFPLQRFLWNEWAYIFLVAFAFVMTGIMCPTGVDFLIYTVVAIILTLVLMHSTIKDIFCAAKRLVERKNYSK